MNVIAAHFFGLAEEGKLGGGEEPLPDVFATSVFVFLLELSRQEHASKSFGQVLGMEPTGLGPSQLADIHKADYNKWGPVIKASGFKPEN